MSLDDRVRLTFPTINYGGDIGEEQPVFEGYPSKKGIFNLEEAVETDFILTSQFDTVNAIISDLLDAGIPDKKGIHWNEGGGSHTFTVTFQTPTVNPDYQWGSSGDETDGPNRHTATAADREAQIAVLSEALRVSSPDSRNPITFEWGEWSGSGFLDPLDIVVPNYSMSMTDEPPFAQITLQIQETTNIDDAYDSEEQVG